MENNNQSQLPKSTIKLENVKVKFLKSYEWGKTFSVSIKAYNKDKTAEARYDNYSCLLSGQDPLQENDTITIVGRFQTEIYNDKLQLKVNVTNLKIVKKTEAPIEIINPDDLPF